MQVKLSRIPRRRSDSCALFVIINMTKKTLSLSIDEPTKKKILLKKFNKTLTDLLQDVTIIKNWVKCQPHLPEIPSDTMIEFFLVNNKFRIEITKQKIDMYYSIRTMMPDLYGISNPKHPSMKKDFYHHYIIPLPKLVDGLHRAEIVKVKDFPFEDLDANAILCKAINVNEVRILEGDFMIGDITIYDFAELKIAHLLKFTPMHLKMLVTMFEKVFSNRVKEMHILHYPPILKSALKLAKNIIKPKIYKRIHLHNSLETLAKFVPLWVLPKDYGGTELSLDELQEQWRLKFEQHQDRFDKLDKLKVNEALRPVPNKNVECFGTEGTFRNINLD